MAAAQNIRVDGGREAPGGETEALPARLRRETASLHAQVEAATGLPGSVRDRGQYVALLQRLHGFHSAVESRLGQADWAEHWDRLGIDLASHGRAGLLAQDLDALGAPAPRPAEHLRGIDSFPCALGCLYVTEGSSLGGRIIGPAIRSTVGDVPTGFFESSGRQHPSPWRTVTRALRRFGDEDGDAAAVVQGARHTFLAFERQVAEHGQAVE
ncbi:biliverdin-producing heme oxygenase [Microbacteriaceae bacterium 4G12]